MTLLKPLLDRLMDTRTETVVYECRNCGTALDSEQGPCPNCDSTEIACHDLS